MLTKKFVILITGISFLLGACKVQHILPSQENLPRIENVHFTHKTDTVNVFYDLQAKSPDSKFDVKLLLSLGNNKKYQIDSTSTTGAIGKGVLPGRKKKISWNVLEDFPRGIQQQKIQFIVNAQKVNSQKISKWIYIASGALLLSGGFLGYLFLKPDDNKGLPLPPVRPSAN